MKTSKQAQQRKYSLDRHAAIVDIDTIVSYLLFITIIIFLVNYVLGLTAPFRTSIDALSKEEGTIGVKYLTSTEFRADEFNNSCSVTYTNVRRFSTSYIIEGFRMPFTDTNTISANLANGSVVFRRDGNTLHVITGSQALNRALSVEVITPNGASVNNVSLETGDSFYTRYDEFGNFVVTLNSNVINGDTDEVTITPANGMITFSIDGLSNLTDSYVGSTRITDTCGIRGLIGKHTSFNKYGSLSTDRELYPVKITGDVWWTD